VDENIKKLLDIEEIKNLKHRYFRAIDMADFHLLEDIFSNDISVDYRGGSYRWQASGKEEIILNLRYSFHNKACGMHNGHHPEIDILDSNQATGKWYLHDVFYNFNENIVTMGSALYDDKYKKIDGEWRIVFSEYDRIWEEVSPINPETKFTKILLSEKGDKIKK
tara:strand:+ start:5545 stop:6039 length:495 start_codon:yes stop_codon:yes gene_type:complete